MLNLKKEVRDIKRFNQIVLVLVEEGFGYLLDKIKVRMPLSKRFKAKKNALKPEQHLRKTFERLGPTFIKLGQLLSVRPDLVPKEYIKELEKLQDSVPRFSFNEVKSIINREFDKPIKGLFRKFEPKPIASASISQVHKAVLKDGSIVAVKVQRPNIRQLMETDIEIMFFFARLLEMHVQGLGRYRPVGIVKEFSEWTKRELDFNIEAQNAQIFYQNFKGSRTVHIPKVYPEYTTSSILAMEFLDGVEIHKLSAIKKKWFNIKKVINNGFTAMLTQIYIHGFFHADPHPSNILILKNNAIGFVDFGIVGYFDERLKKASAKMFVAMVEHDIDKVVEVLFEIGKLDKDVDVGHLKLEISKILFELKAGKQIKDVKVSVILEEVLNTALNYGLHMPTEFVLFAKTIITIEGIALEYSPDFRFIDSAEPFIKKMLKREFSPQYIASDIIDTSIRFKRFFSGLPEKVDKTLERLQKGTLKIDIEDTDINRLAIEIDKSSNRLAYGMLIAALLVTGALIIQVGEPIIFGLPLISFISFSFALLLVIFLFISILKERKLYER